MAGMSPISLTEDDVRKGDFHGAAAVVFGDGAASEIVNGWKTDAPTRVSPWEPAATPRGISNEGVAPIARFVRNGGRVVTIGRSAGLVAPSLVNVELSRARPGIGQVRLEIAPAGRALFGGVPASGGRARAFLAAVPDGSDGAYLFKPSRGAEVLAWYDGADDRPAEQSFADTAPLTRSAGHAAIVEARAGNGSVVIFGFSPVFRAQWRSTFPLLFNALAGR